jgi:hypothetical protein
MKDTNDDKYTESVMETNDLNNNGNSKVKANWGKISGFVKV